MSSALGGRDDLTSPLGGPQNKPEDLPFPDTPSKIGQQGEQKLDTPHYHKIDQRAPRSIPDVDLQQQQQKQKNLGQEAEEDQPASVSVSNEEGDEGELVPAAGRINEKGEVIDDDGNAIGKVTSGNARDFVDFVVTQEGDILDRAGGVVGKAEPLEDVASELHYYTTANNPARDNAKDDNDQTAAGEAGDEAKQAKGGGLGGAFGGVGKALGGLTGGLGRTAKGATGTVGGATKGVTDAAGEATGAEGVTGAVGDTAEGVTGAAGDTVEGAAGTADEVTAGGAEGAGGAVGDATDKVGETAEGAVDGAQDTAEGVVDKAGSAVEGVPGELGSKADDLAEGADGELGSKVDELAEQEPIPIEIPEFAPSVAAKVVAMFEGPFTVADDGQVTDQNGKILGKLAEGQDIQDLIGKEIKGIDEEGNLLGDENTVLGKVNLAPEGTIVERIKEQVPEAVERLDAIQEVKSKLPDISILEGLNINKAGNVVDEKGNVMGRIKSGDIKKLVGKQPDAEGRIWDTRGNVIGEVEVVPEAIENLVAPFEDFPDAFVDKEGKVIFEGRQIGIVSEGDVANLVGKKVDVDGDIMDKNGNVIGKALRKDPDEEPEPEVEQIDYSSLQDKKINKMGNVVDDNGQIWGRVVQGVLKNLVGKRVSENGEIFNDAGKIIGKVEPLAEEERQEVREPAPFEDFPDAVVADEGKVMFNGEQIGIVVEGDAKKLKGKTVDADGDIVDRNGNVLGHADRWEPDEPEVEQIDYSSLRDKKINKMGNVVDDKGQIWGRVIQGVLKNLVGKRVGENGEIFNDAGKLIGKVEPLAEEERQEIREPAPFEDFPDAVVADEGKVMFNGQQIGIVVEGDAKKLKGKTVDADGDIVDRNGNVLGHAERWEPEVEQIDYSSLRDKKINKMGNVVDDRGQIWGRVVQGVLTNLIGKRVGENGEIFNDAGKVIGKAEPLTDGERQDVKEPAPFEDFPNAVIADEGKVMFNGEQIGIVVEGDAKKLKGKTVDADGDIVDRNGNVLGRAERWESEAPEPEPEIDNSALAGKRINKAGNAVDSHGDIYGRVVEGDLSRLIGKMCDKNGFIRNEGGDVIGKAELLPEAEREGLKEGPFAELPGCTVNKEGHVVTPSGDIVGRLVSGDPKILFGRAVDDDGDILDRNGNVLGHAERWEPEEQPKDVNPMSGRKVNRDGNVVDENGDLIGKLTSGDLYKCAGKKIDDDGDVVDQKGSIVGHVTLLEDIPPEPEAEPEEQESEEDRLKREQLEQDRKIAKQICICIEHSLDKIRPICKMITENIDRAERTPEDERDEEELVRVVRPLIEEGGKILTEANGVIRGLDPDGRISANAKHKTAAREATPEEYHLADLLKELTGTVTETIENAKRKLEDMKYAKKELNPLWGLLAEPLFQIIAAVGLLLTGVLGLVGKLLNGLGLGGLVNNLLGGLGLTKVLDGLGLGSIVGAVTGQDDKKKKKSGGGGKFLGIL